MSKKKKKKNNKTVDVAESNRLKIKREDDFISKIVEYKTQDFKISTQEPDDLFKKIKTI